MSLANICRHARIKGLTVIGTGDILFAPWRTEVLSCTVVDSSGFLLYDDLKIVPTTEVCLSFYQMNRLRKVHLLVVFPDISCIRDFVHVFSKSANFEHAARPTIKINGEIFIKNVRGISEEILVIPAHIFTPWYGILGANSGFDSIKDCFREEVSHIFAVETGLSADPALAYSVPFLRNFSFVSFSDAHSPGNLGREAIVVREVKTYRQLFNLLKHGEPTEFFLTIEVFPETGKYFRSGHRKCGFISESPAPQVVCPVCGKTATQGVESRILQLGGNTENNFSKVPFVHTVSLMEFLKMCKSIIPEFDTMATYEKAIAELGSEFEVMVFAGKEKLASCLGKEFAEYVMMLRSGHVKKEYGYDGLYGRISLK